MPLTVGVQVDVCVVRMDAEEQINETDVIAGDVGGVPPLPLTLLPPQPATTVKTTVAINRVANLHPKVEEL